MTPPPPPPPSVEVNLLDVVNCGPYLRLFWNLDYRVNSFAVTLNFKYDRPVASVANLRRAIERIFM